MTRRDLAAKLNVRPSTITDWEKRGQQPRIDQIVKIISIFKIPLETFVFKKL